MRSKKTILNTIFSLLEQIVSMISAFILPKLILSHFGSTYNGLVNSISQFLGCAVLLRSGIGAATNAALYKPLADNNQDEINSIIKATDIYMKKIGLILVFAIVAFSIIYPVFVKAEFDWLFTFSLFLIIGISTFAETFFGVTYRIILQADQKTYISSIINTICSVFNVILASILILLGQGIHIVKLGSAFAFSLYPIITSIYVNKKYNINKNVEPNYKAIGQRWDSFWHQVTLFVNNNTDVIVLTIFTNMLTVSIYSVYNMVISGLKNLISSFTSGVDAAFGNMMAKNENEAMNKNFSVIELIVYSLSTSLYTCAIILVLQFVQIYTIGITDVNYLIPSFAYILLVAHFFYSVRSPYQALVQGAGHFRQTKKFAVAEVLLNIVISVLLVSKFGLIGISIGTFVALLYRTIAVSNYVSYHFLHRNKFVTYKKCLISFCEGLIIIGIYKLIHLPIEINYYNWIFNGFICFFLSCIVIFMGIMIFYRKDFLNFLEIINRLKKSKKRSKVEKNN